MMSYPNSIIIAMLGSVLTGKICGCSFKFKAFKHLKVLKVHCVFLMRLFKQYAVFEFAFGVLL